MVTLCFCTSVKEEEASADRLKTGLLTKLLDEDLCADVSSLHVQKIISAISELLERLKSYGEDYTADKQKVHSFFPFSLYCGPKGRKI